MELKIYTKVNLQGKFKDCKYKEFTKITFSKTYEQP